MPGHAFCGLLEFPLALSLPVGYTPHILRENCCLWSLEVGGRLRSSGDPNKP